MTLNLRKLILAGAAVLLSSFVAQAQEQAIAPAQATSAQMQAQEQATTSASTPALDTLVVPGPAEQPARMKERTRNMRVFPYQNCVRLGIGDMFFETLVWHNQVKMDYSGTTDPTGFGFSNKTNYRYTPHFSLEYMRRVLPWLSVGAMVDFQSTMWTRNMYNTQNALIGSYQENFYNLIVAPGFRIKYFRRKNVEFYGGMFMGIDINGGTELDWKGHNTAIGMGMNYVAFGVEAGAGHWFGFLDLGGTIAMQNFNTLYMMLSQIAKVGVSYRF